MRGEDQNYNYKRLYVTHPYHFTDNHCRCFVFYQ